MSNERITTQQIGQAAIELALLTLNFPDSRVTLAHAVQGLGELLILREQQQNQIEALTSLRDEIMSLKDRDMYMTADEMIRRIDAIRGRNERVS